MPFGAHWNPRPKHRLSCIPAVICRRQARVVAGLTEVQIFQTTCDVASQHRIQHERLDAHQMQSRFPAFFFEGDEEGYYEPEAVMPVVDGIEVQLRAQSVWGPRSPPDAHDGLALHQRRLSR